MTKAISLLEEELWHSDPDVLHEAVLPALGVLRIDGTDLDDDDFEVVLDEIEQLVFLCAYIGPRFASLWFYFGMCFYFGRLYFK